jgi:hypothetical protein
MQAQKVLTLPSIDSVTPGKLANITNDDHVIIQEKINGSQFTIFKKDGELHFYNRNKEVGPKGDPYVNAYLSLQKKKDFFQTGLFYHGEAMKTTKTNNASYKRMPRYYWIVYEIQREDGSLLTPDEMTATLLHTGIETTQVLYDSHKNISLQPLQEIIDQIMVQIESDIIESCLGGIPEGIVIKVLKGTTNSRFKQVRSVFAEMSQVKRDKIEQVSDIDFIKEIGEIYNTNGRREKAVQHMKEKGKYNEKNVNANIGQMVHELDDDLLKEAEEDIKNILFVRFFPEISKVARGDVPTFLRNKE